MLIMTFLSLFACDWSRSGHETSGEVCWGLLGKRSLRDRRLAHKEKVSWYPDPLLLWIYCVWLVPWQPFWACESQPCRECEHAEESTWETGDNQNSDVCVESP